MLKKIIFLIFLLITGINLIAQEDIHSLKIFSYNTDYKFTNEWQYLSSDFYLLYPNKFNKLLNEIAGISVKKRRNWQKFTKDKINSLLITAQLVDVKNYDNILFPIYYFQVGTSEEGYKTRYSTSHQEIHLIENLPLVSINKDINIKLETKAITENKKNTVVRTVAKQLKEISRLTNPSEAVLSIIGEFGKLMDHVETKNGDKQYQFSTTVEIFEKTDFNKQFHSISVFAFMPNSKASEFNLSDSTEIARLNTLFSKNERNINYYCKL